MIAALEIGLAALRHRSGKVVALLTFMVSVLITVLLCLASTLPAALTVASNRENLRYPASAPNVSYRPVLGAPLVACQRDTLWKGRHITVIVIVTRPGASPPPGVAVLPEPGHSVVSPALDELLRAHDAQELAKIVPEPTGHIGREGLTEPNELFAYVGVAAIKGGTESLLISGWGIRGAQLFKSSISPYLGLPVVALILIPLMSLMAALLRLDGARRAARLSRLRVLGATQRQLLGVDAGLIFAPIAVGWAITWIAEPLLNLCLSRIAFGNQLFFAQDLRTSAIFHCVALGVLVGFSLVASMESQEPDSHFSQIAGGQQLRLARRSAVAGVLLVLGSMLSVAVLSGGSASGLRSYQGILPPVVLWLAGIIVGFPVALIGFSRLLVRHPVASDLLSARLRSRRLSSYSSSIALILVGIVAGLSFAVLTVLDVAAQTDQVLWNPASMAPNESFVSLSLSDAQRLTKSQQFGQPLVALPIPTVVLSDGAGHAAQLRGVEVACDALDIFIEIPAQVRAPCAAAWVVDGALNPQTTAATVQVTGSAARINRVMTGGRRAPVALLGGTESVIIPVPTAKITAALAQPDPSLSRNTINSVFLLPSPERVQALRSALWMHEGFSLTGASGPLSSVVSRTDFQEDGQLFRDRYSRFVIGLLGMSALVCLVTVCLVGVSERQETEHRNALLFALGVELRTMATLIRSEVVLPSVLATAVGGMAGAVLGVCYLGLSDYEQLSGPLHGFPVGRLAIYLLLQLAMLAIVVVPIAGWATGKVRAVWQSGTVVSAEYLS